MIVGGEGVFFARLTGPRKLRIQSLPFSRLAGRMLQAACRLDKLLPLNWAKPATALAA
jgi:uncharacterized protein (AIM24 family)